MVNAQLTIRCLASNNSRPLCVSRIFRGDFYNIFHNMLAFSLIVDGQIKKIKNKFRPSQFASKRPSVSFKLQRPCSTRRTYCSNIVFHPRNFVDNFNDHVIFAIFMK